MHARISRVQAPVDRIDDMISEFTGSVLPVLREINGYAGHALAVDRGSGDCQAVTFWESESALEASEDAGGRLRTQTTTAASASVVSIARLETVMMERSGPPRTPAVLRVTRANADPAKLDDLARRMREDALPTVQGLSGFRALTLGVDRRSGDFVITSVWGSPEDREASMEAIREIRKETFAAIGASDPDASNYEVASVEFVGVPAA